ncbi:NAD-dependent deacylase [Aggregicoccus sp. 17bor-14]|uniref:SIR2 family NAD-dependent protein deacylase n=1 Tax=Myxococcaceae TaxID=31 RepID=UPI00129CECC2|nr:MULTISPECIES: NAD-dependent deacylase [Myxococcaceae]MBF5044057.1 NAD-dependent deacylase [Simulacricoccus sp. 17bor-14]MRI89808.1 NAD-dependent deacylase [Aggregicoccus sp. 17bor-14]
METLRIDPSTRLLVLTGAGVSAESGIPTFRGIDGLWERHPVQEVASPQGFRRDPALVWRFYSQRRQAAAGVQPNPGHRALVEWERRLGDRFLLATQNVDGLHRLAGSERVVELHGELFKSRCAGCSRAPFEDRTAYAAGEVPRCGACGGSLRPHIVWFGEALDERNLARIQRFIEAGPGSRLVFLAAGTSGAVYPAAGLVEVAREAGAQCWLVNADPADNGHAFHHFVQGKSGEVLPGLVRFA